jgi:hypothetical protein
MMRVWFWLYASFKHIVFRFSFFSSCYFIRFSPFYVSLLIILVWNRWLDRSTSICEVLVMFRIWVSVDALFEVEKNHLWITYIFGINKKILLFIKVNVEFCIIIIIFRVNSKLKLKLLLVVIIYYHNNSEVENFQTKTIFMNLL